ncbi:hypothetical protein [Neomesorhizobium albiziae]|uniref:hypothetical protein n=1 Tax=Neomesorhizobium albiziae TaxID=335020 RepID=UPI00122CE9F9|nr:hypothetical protein [Mesorhizobium albiziae]
MIAVSGKCGRRYDAGKALAASTAAAAYYWLGSLAKRWPIFSASASLIHATGTDIFKKSGATVLADESDLPTRASR